MRPAGHVHLNVTTGQGRAALCGAYKVRLERVAGVRVRPRVRMGTEVLRRRTCEARMGNGASDAEQYVRSWLTVSTPCEAACDPRAWTRQSTSQVLSGYARLLTSYIRAAEQPLQVYVYEAPGCYRRCIILPPLTKMTTVAPQVCHFCPGPVDPIEYTQV